MTEPYSLKTFSENIYDVFTEWTYLSDNGIYADHVTDSFTYFGIVNSTVSVDTFFFLR